uniref:Rho guanine nucleotide exchange factor 17 n=1 Tax=Syphacia muris TaxID=451379 RepID=A0A158R4R1_9BILA
MEQVSGEHQCNLQSMGNAKASDVCWEAETYLKNAQEVISRSFHELASFELYDCEIGNNNRKFSSALCEDKKCRSSTLQRRNSTFELNSCEADEIRPNCGEKSLRNSKYDACTQSLFAVNEFDNNLITRRKRFTRRQHRGSSRDLLRGKYRSASGLNNLSSSSDDEGSSKDSDNVLKKHFRRTEHKKRSVQRSKGSLLDRLPSMESLSAGYQPQAAVIRNSQLTKSKGPAARKVQRRAAASKFNYENYSTLNQARSHARLDSVDASEVVLPVRRSISVKDINGTMVDFLNQESVVRWTSQVLAELDSLPSSQVNLNASNIKAKAMTSATDSQDKQSSEANSQKNRCHKNITNNTMFSSLSSCSSTISDVATCSTLSLNCFSNPQSCSVQDIAEMNESILSSKWNTGSDTPRVVTPHPTEEKWIRNKRTCSKNGNNFLCSSSTDLISSSKNLSKTKLAEIPHIKSDNEVTPSSHHSLVECTSNFNLSANNYSRQHQHACAVIIIPQRKKSITDNSTSETKVRNQTSRETKSSSAVDSRIAQPAVNMKPDLLSDNRNTEIFNSCSCRNQEMNSVEPKEKLQLLSKRSGRQTTLNDADLREFIENKSGLHHIQFWKQMTNSEKSGIYDGSELNEECSLNRVSEKKFKDHTDSVLSDRDVTSRQWREQLSNRRERGCRSSQNLDRILPKNENMFSSLTLWKKKILCCSIVLASYGESGILLCIGGKRSIQADNHIN